MRRGQGALRTAASAVPLVGVLVVTLAGCTTGSPGQAPPATRGEEGPLDELIYSGLGVDTSLPGAVQQFVAQTARREDATAACMKAAGFDYIPNVPDATRVTLAPTGALDPASREFAEQYGFGIARQPDWEAGEVFWSGTDPNAARRAQMSDAERDAYDTALWGEVTDSRVDAQGSTSQTRAGGCRDRTSGDSAPVYDEATEFLAELPEDGAFDEIDHAWSACMSDAGFAYDSPGAARRTFDDRMTAASTDGALDPSEVAAIADDEIPAAVASWDCEAKVDYTERYREIRDRLEQQWIDAHRAELDAWAAGRTAATAAAQGATEGLG